jgi:hypothetical protein|tara:strand:- start:474 stop:887 length:414 start_codon:yes stop_codon:yes gene_type:complete
MTTSYPKFFVDSNATTRIDLEDNQYIDIKKEMSLGDYETYEASLLQIEAESENGTSSRAMRRRGQANRQADQKPPKMKLQAGYVDLLLVNIVSWSFENVPVTRVNIEKLSSDVSEIIVSAIQEANPINPLEKAGQMT